MEYLITIIIILVIISVLTIVLIAKNKKEQQTLYNARIEEAVKSIEILMEEKEKKLESTINIIKEHNKKKYGKKEILSDLIKNKNKKLNMFEQFKELEKLYVELKNIIDEDPKLKELKDLNKTMYKLRNIENELLASIKYYNKYNKTDKFTIEKIEEFEILKENNIEPKVSN